MNKHFLYTEKEDLSTRSQNIINDLGGIEPLLNFYEKHIGFLRLNKVGKFSNDELSSFCRYLLSKAENENPIEIVGHSHDNFDIKNCISVYEDEKKFLNTRTNNILNTLENNNDYYSGTSN